MKLTTEKLVEMFGEVAKEVEFVDLPAPADEEHGTMDEDDSEPAGRDEPPHEL